MVDLSFKLNDVTALETIIVLKIKDLKVTDEDGNVFNEIGSFGRIDTSVSDIEGIRVAKYCEIEVIYLLGFGLNPNFTYKASVRKSPDWLCVRNNNWLDFSHRAISLNLLEHPVSNDISSQVRKLYDLLKNINIDEDINKIKEHIKELQEFKKEIERDNIKNVLESVFPIQEKINLLELLKNILEVKNETELRELVNKRSLEKYGQIIKVILSKKEEFQQNSIELQQQKKLEELASIVIPNGDFDFTNLKTEIIRLKSHDLISQIQNEKDKLEQLTTSIERDLSESGKYLLKKLLKKHAKIIQNNDNLEKLKEIKQTLSNDLTDKEKIQELLNKQSETIQLEKQLNGLQIQITNNN